MFFNFLGVFINERTRQLRPENRAIDFITNGYEEVPVSHCQLWKPHALYYPHHGEAPPPYEEAVAAAEMGRHCNFFISVSIYLSSAASEFKTN